MARIDRSGLYSKNIIDKTGKMLDIIREYINQLDVYRVIYEENPNSILLDEQKKKIARLAQYKKYADKYYEIVNYFINCKDDNPMHSVLYTRIFEDHSLKFLNEVYNYSLNLTLEEIINLYTLISLIPEKTEKKMMRDKKDNVIMFRYVNVELVKNIYKGKEYINFENSKIRLYNLGSKVCNMEIRNNLNELKKVKVI